MTISPSERDEGRIFEILKEAGERLETARVGFQQAKLGPYAVKGGFRNVAVFGKMVTFCTNNLRGKLDGFEKWDEEAKRKYFDNDASRAMSDARNQFEKQARNPIFSSTHIKQYSAEVRDKLPRPPNAIAFFMGDRQGGSGWMLQMENGDKIPFYINLPPEIGEVKTILTHAGKSLDLLQTSEEYLTLLEAYMADLHDFVKVQVS
jgi:hypothetical protein